MTTLTIREFPGAQTHFSLGEDPDLDVWRIGYVTSIYYWSETKSATVFFHDLPHSTSKLEFANIASVALVRS